MAAILAAHPTIALTLLAHGEVQRALSAVGFGKLPRLASLTVDAEEKQLDGLRRDVVLRLFDRGGHVLTVILEAKSTGLRLGALSAAALHSQLDSYIQGQSEADTPGVARIGIALTRVKSLAGIGPIATLTWNDLIDLISAHPGAEFAQQYRSHLLMNAGFRYFDSEVLSVPAGDTLGSIESHREGYSAGGVTNSSGAPP